MKENAKEMILHLDPLHPLIKTEIIDAGGKTHVKYVESSVLTQSMEQHLHPAPQHTGLLPPNCIALSSIQDEWEITLVSDFDRCTLTYHKTVYPDFPIPRIAVRCKVNQAGLASVYHLAVLAQGDLTPETPLYHCPFPNVSGFSLCTGNNTLSGYDTLWKTRGLVNRVLTLPFADDYYKAEQTKLKCSARELFEHLKDKDPSYYYNDVLIPSGKTLSDFI